MSYVRASTDNPNGFRPWNSRLSGLGADPRLTVRSATPVRRRRGLSGLGDSTAPDGAIENVNYYARILSVSGWASDGNHQINAQNVMILVDGQPVGSAQLGIGRTDNPPGNSMGFSFQMPTTQLAAGSHVVSAQAISANGASAPLRGSQSFNIPASEGGSGTGTIIQAVAGNAISSVYALSPTGVPLTVPATTSSSGIYDTLNQPIALPVLGNVPLMYVIGGGAALLFLLSGRKR